MRSCVARWLSSWKLADDRPLVRMYKSSLGLRDSGHTGCGGDADWDAWWRRLTSGPEGFLQSLGWEHQGEGDSDELLIMQRSGEKWEATHFSLVSQGSAGRVFY